MSARPQPGRYEREIRTLVVGGLLFLLFLSGVSLIVMRNVETWGERELTERLVSGTRLVARRISGLGDAASLDGDERLAELLHEAGARSAAAYGPDGARVWSARFLPDADLVPPRAERGLPREEQARVERRDATVVVWYRVGAVTARAAYPAGGLVTAGRIQRIVSGVVVAASLGLCLLVAPFLRRLFRPLDALKETAAAARTLGIGEGGGDDPDSAVATFARTIRELEELRRREQERADALAVTAATLIRSHPGGLAVIDASGRLADANEQALADLGTGADAVGRPAGDALADIPALGEAVGRAARGEATLGLELTIGDETGGRRLAATVVPVEDASGTPLGTLLFLEDRTATRRLERELSARRELAALGEMSAGIAHEFRNATATILGWARLAAATDDAPARARHLLAIRKEAEHVARITGDFLLFARPERFVMAPTDLGPLLAEVVEKERLSAPGASIALEGDPGPVSADQTLLSRALGNLVKNACEAACAGGRAGRVLVAAERSETGMRITVEDDGPGIAPEAEPKLFVPFGTTKDSGTGLGLALVAKIAALHAGSVTAGRSERLGGARFVLALPVS